MYIILILDKNLKSVLMIIKCPNNGTLTLSENWARDVIFQSLRLSFYSLVFSPLFISFSLFVAVWYRSEIKRNNVKSEFIERFTYLRIHNAVLFIVRLFRYSRKDIKRIKISLSDTSMQFRYTPSIEGTFTFRIISCVRGMSAGFAYILTDYIYTRESGYEAHIKQRGET